MGSCLFQAEDGIRDLVRSRGLGDVYKRQHFFDNETGKTEHQLGFAAPQKTQREGASRALRAPVGENFLVDEQRFLKLLRQVEAAHAPFDLSLIHI